jgi:hypothetical protein
MEFIFFPSDFPKLVKTIDRAHFRIRTEARSLNHVHLRNPLNFLPKMQV